MASTPSKQQAELSALSNVDDPKVEVSDEQQVEPLAEDGDVILVLRRCLDSPEDVDINEEPIKLLCDSKLLSDASEVFKKMFGPDFKEGKAIREGNRPEIALWEEDPELMRMIILAIHGNNMTGLPVDGGSYVWYFAEQVEKYDCGKAILPLIQDMCEQAAEQKSSYRFTRPYSERCKEASSEVMKDEWDGMLRLAAQLHPDIPHSVMRELIGSARIDWVLDFQSIRRLASPLLLAVAKDSYDVRSELTGYLLSITQDVLTAESDYSGLFCDACKMWTMSLEAIECARCGRKFLKKIHCNPKTRAAKYRNAMQEWDRWKMPECGGQISAQDMIDETEAILKDFKHNCPNDLKVAHISLEDAETEVEGLMKIGGHWDPAVEHRLQACLRALSSRCLMQDAESNWMKLMHRRLKDAVETCCYRMLKQSRGS